MPEDPGDLLYLFALQNAVKYGDIPREGTVLAKLLGEHPEFRPRARELSRLAREAVQKVGTLSAEGRRAELAKRAPHLLEDLHAGQAKEHRLPPLAHAVKGEVVMRFAPNPSGPLHLGHARAAVLNDAYVKEYGGKYILRIEDTDPRRVDPEAYRTVQEDIAWLGLTIHDIVYQSDRLDIYYDYAGKLIAMGAAYVCTCEAEQFRDLKLGKKPCPCRVNDADTNLALWQDMLDGRFVEGEVTVRVKTELDHPDPAMRDFSAFRIVSSPPHPRVEAQVFPLMNFSVAIDDHLLGVTHVIRGKDHIANTGRQKYIFGYFGWQQPVYMHYGRMGIEGVVLSTSQMRAGIAAGTYTGWDDVRLGTLRAIARRGIQPEAVRNAVLDIGIGETDISFSWDNLYARNREIVDPLANRFFFVPDPVRVEVRGAAARVAAPLVHPGNIDRGTRILHFADEVYVPKEDLAGRTALRLKDLFNVAVERIGGEAVFTCTGDALADARREKLPVVQWLPVDESLPCTLRTMEGDTAGFCEPVVAHEVGRVVQFERVGFARIDAATEKGVVAYFAHR